MTDIFLSYARKDRDKAIQLAKALEDKGWSVWWDPRIPAGKVFDEVIEEALDAAKCVVVLWSKRSIKSRWVKTEAGEGLDRDIIVPAFIENVRPPLAFRRVQAANLIDWDGNIDNSEYRNLIDSISGIIGSPPKKQTNVQAVSSQSGTDRQPLSEAEPPVTFKNTIGMEFVLIPAGSFMMGSNLSPKEAIRRYGGDAEWLESEHPQQKVTISKPFYLQTTEVTQGQWKSVMGNNSSRFEKCGDDCPVEKVSWNDVQEFLTNLNKLEGLEGADRYRLPSEAEWEYACRAGTTTDFSFGDDAGQLGDYAWFADNSADTTHPVATKKPNAWGLYDMHGNVWEWTEDDWHYNYDGSPDDGRAWGRDPRGTGRVVRGGSWRSEAPDCRSAARGKRAPDSRFSGLGFRLAISAAIPQTEGPPKEAPTRKKTEDITHPDLDAMVEVPAGEFIYQDGKARIDKPYLIDVYPVTNRQYERFVKAGGYSMKNYWSPKGWHWLQKESIKHPLYWGEDPWSLLDHPVIGISFYEAEACANWAGKRLPTEQEWERAARGKYGNEYPWGNTFDRKICNTGAKGINRTTQVDRYPNGLSPVGCYDMAGNVWEWTDSLYNEKGRYPVLRGGSYGIHHNYARCTSRSYNSFGYRNTNVGFRCVKDLD